MMSVLGYTIFHAFDDVVTPRDENGWEINKSIGIFLVIVEIATVL